MGKLAEAYKQAIKPQKKRFILIFFASIKKDIYEVNFTKTSKVQYANSKLSHE